jgi:hypothetical protein
MNVAGFSGEPEGVGRFGGSPVSGAGGSPKEHDASVCAAAVAAAAESNLRMAPSL